MVGEWRCSGKEFHVLGAVISSFLKTSQFVSGKRWADVEFKLAVLVFKHCTV